MTAINFPAGAATGATHTEAGITWTFDGTTWDTTGVGYVAKGGDTMTGNLTVPSLNGGQLAGFRNILINGDMKVNQRRVTIAAAAVGAYGPDRWKKADAGNMTQIVEDVNYIPGATYTLSGTGVTTQQLTAPSTGHWTLPNIPITATNIQLEVGTVATPFEHRSYGLELTLCKRYYQDLHLNAGGSTALSSGAGSPVGAYFTVPGFHLFRAAPTLVVRNAFVNYFNGAWVQSSNEGGGVSVPTFSILPGTTATIQAGNLVGTISSGVQIAGIGIVGTATAEL